MNVKIRILETVNFMDVGIIKDCVAQILKQIINY